MSIPLIAVIKLSLFLFSVGLFLGLTYAQTICYRDDKKLSIKKISIFQLALLFFWILLLVEKMLDTFGVSLFNSY
jgi:hypothetical protein